MLQTNCLTETYFEQAQERARQLDEIKAQGRSAGPLHGLPISIKDGFQVMGSEATIGFVSYLDKISDKNSPLVDILLQLGAVIHVKTNIPQTLMTADSHNNIFGRTLNPHKTTLTAGGSSGGEGALVAFRGSPLGIGTDIAGSIRIPSLCDGTYGFKPTTSRVPYGGQAPSGPRGMNFFLACAGPLANDIEALRVLVRAVIDAKPATFDSTALDIPWRHVQGHIKPKLKLGLVPEDPRYPLHPPVKRAIGEAVRLLEAEGHVIVPLQASECHVADATDVAFAFFNATGSRDGPIQAGGEPMVPSVVAAKRVVLELTKRTFAGEDDCQGIPRIAALNVKRSEIAEEWRRLWNKHQLDGVIAPSAQHTAVPHDQYLIPPYTVFLNTLDVSAFHPEPQSV